MIVAEFIRAVFNCEFCILLAGTPAQICNVIICRVAVFIFVTILILGGNVFKQINFDCRFCRLTFGAFTGVAGFLRYGFFQARFVRIFAPFKFFSKFLSCVRMFGVKFFQACSNSITFRLFFKTFLLCCKRAFTCAGRIKIIFYAFRLCSPCGRVAEIFDKFFCNMVAFSLIFKAFTLNFALFLFSFRVFEIISGTFSRFFTFRRVCKTRFLIL